jgi:DNA-binding transcriptional LysR family regulator
MENCCRDCWRGSSRHPNLQISLDMHAPEAIELLRTGKIDVAIIFPYDETEPEPAAIRPIPYSTTPCASCPRARNGPWPTCARACADQPTVATPARGDASKSASIVIVGACGSLWTAVTVTGLSAWVVR